MLHFIISKTLFGYQKDILCSFVYIPPYQSPYYRNKDWACQLTKVEEFLVQTLENKSDVTHLVMGDLNARIGDWTLEEDTSDDVFDSKPFCYGNRSSKDKISNHFSKYLTSFCNMFKLVPLNGNASNDYDGHFTFVAEQGSSVVDYALVSSELYVTNIYDFEVVKNRVESKHAPIHLALPKGSAKVIDEIVLSENNTFDKLKWDKEKSDKFLTNMASEETVSALQMAINNINICLVSALDIFNNTILKAAECMRRSFRLQSGKQATNRWYDKECADQKREARRARTKWHRTDNGNDRHDYCVKRNLYTSLVREKNKDYKNGLKDTLIKERKNCMKFWNTSKEIRSKNKSQPCISLEKWSDHFQSVFGTNEIEDLQQKEKTKEIKPMIHIPELDDAISEDEVKSALHSMKLGKASGLDEICSEFLKYSGNAVIPFLTLFFNRLYDACFFPICWTKSIIIPLFKRGDESDPDNYRGISLLSTVSKLFTYILNKRLYAWAEKENKISYEQAGFRHSYSTMDHIFTLISIVQNCFNKPRGGKVYACFVDYRKAFDTVDRNKVWEKLEKLNTSSKLLAMLQAIYSSVQACVRWNGKLSGSFSCPFGLKQGCLLSPLIFSLLIGDVADHVRENGLHGFQLLPGGQEIFSLLFADDIVLLSSTPHGLQRQINSLETSSKTIGLQVNLEKTKVMVFRKGGFLGRREKWSLSGQPIEVVSSYRYLGYLLTTQLSENSACEEFESKSKGKILDILKTMWCLGSMNTHIFFQFFDCQIKPMLLYASEIWGLSNVESIEAAHLFAMKRLLGVSNKTPNTLVYGELGRYSLHVDSTLSVIRYWLKLLKMPNTRLPKQCLLNMTNIVERQRQNCYVEPWIKKVKDCLIKYGYQDVWNDQSVRNEKEFLRTLKTKLVEEFKIKWYQKLTESERFTFYRSFKRSFYQEEHLNNVTLKRFRVTLTRFRLGVNELGINRRFHGDQNSKYCPFCPSCIEDENHFIFVCPRYQLSRMKYLQHIIKPYHIDASQILELKNVDSQRKIAMYLYYCFKTREDEAQRI